MNGRIAARHYEQAHRQATAQGMSLHRYIGHLVGIGLSLDARRMSRAMRAEIERRRRPAG